MRNSAGGRLLPPASPRLAIVYAQPSHRGMSAFCAFLPLLGPNGNACFGSIPVQRLKFDPSERFWIEAAGGMVQAKTIAENRNFD